MGSALLEKGEIVTAISSYKNALQCQPNYAEAHNDLGNALLANGGIDSAIISYKNALQCNPNYPVAHKNLSMLELLKGNYRRGLRRYEYRLQSENTNEILNANPKCKQWNGETIPKDGKLLLVSEQGLGDTLQFMRYAEVLKNQGLTVSLCAPIKLHTLIQASEIDASPLTPEQANKVTEGEWIPLLSALRILEVTPEKPIITRPYIKTFDNLKLKWGEILPKKQHSIIGINWQGNPDHEKTNSKGRSLPLEALLPLLQ